MVTSLLGKVCTFGCSSIHTPQKSFGNSFSNIHGEIVGAFVSDPRLYDFCVGSPKPTARTMLIIQLGTFSKDDLVEIPIEVVHIHECLEDALNYCKVE